MVASAGTLRKVTTASNFKTPRISFLQSSNSATRSRGWSRSDWVGDSDSYDMRAKRGGGKTGWRDRGISSACKVSAAPVTAMGAEAKATSGSRNATAVTSGFSDPWQNDIEQFIISPM